MIQTNPYNHEEVRGRSDYSVFLNIQSPQTHQTRHLNNKSVLEWQLSVYCYSVFMNIQSESSNLILKYYNISEVLSSPREDLGCFVRRCCSMIFFRLTIIDSELPLRFKLEAGKVSISKLEKLIAGSSYERILNWLEIGINSISKKNTSFSSVW